MNENEAIDALTYLLDTDEASILECCKTSQLVD